MQVELKIKEILAGEGNVKHKTNEIRKFMNWDEKKLTEAIIKHGTSKEGRASIIKKLL